MEVNLTFDVRLVPVDDDSAAVRLVKILNPDVPESVLADRLRSMREQHSHYSLYGAYVQSESEERLAGLAGAWVATKLWCGRYLEIDNLVVDPDFRARGVASALIKHLEARAEELQCTLLALDSYASNRDAHRLFYRHGIEVWSFHFIKELGDWQGTRPE